MSTERQYHSEPKTTKAFLSISKAIHSKRPELNMRINQGAMVDAPNKQRFFYFDFAYAIALWVFGFFLFTAIIFNIVLLIVNPLSLNITLATLFIGLGASHRVTGVFYYKKIEAKKMSRRKFPDDSPIKLTKEELRKSIIRGVVIGLILYFFIYGSNVFIYLNPRFS